MIVDDRELPIINVASYRRDLYQLIVLLLADEKVAGDVRFRELSEVYHDTEVNRLLIWIATATRHLLDLRHGAMAAAPCGQYWDRYPGEDYDAVPLRFRQACNFTPSSRSRTIRTQGITEG